MPLEELDFAASVGGCAPRAACDVPLEGDGERAKRADAADAADAGERDERGERGELAERGFNTTGALAAGVRTGKGPVSTLGIGPLAAGRAAALRVTACLAGDGERAKRADAADAADAAERAERAGAAVVAFLSSSYK